MRFYPSGLTVRILSVATWGILAALRISDAVNRGYIRDPLLFWATMLTVLIFTLQFTVYWQVTPTALVRHRFFVRTVVPYGDITLVAPYRPNSKAVDFLQIQRVGGKPLMGRIDNRPAFLEALEQHLPAWVLQA